MSDGLDIRDSVVPFPLEAQETNPLRYFERIGVYGCDLCGRRQCECERPSFVVACQADVRAHASVTPSGQPTYECAACGEQLKTRTVEKAERWIIEHDCDAAGIEIGKWLKEAAA